MNWHTLILALMMTVFCSLSIAAEKSDVKSLYVAANGNDAWSGKVEKPNRAKKDGPFKTLQHARDEVRKLLQAGVNKRICVEIAPGIYQMSEPLEFTSEDSGTSARPVEYRAKIAGKVRLVGGRVVTGFKAVTDPGLLARMDPKASRNVFQADLNANGITDFQIINSPASYQSDPGLEVFFKDKPMTLARYPNEGYMKIADVYDDNGVVKSGQTTAGTGKFACDDPRIARWAGEKGIWMHGFWFWDWADQRIPLASVDPAKKTISMETHQTSAYGIRRGQWFYAENVLPELDSPGEWYLDRETGMLLIWPTASLKSGRVMVSVVRDPIRMNNVSNITFRGLTFEDGRGTAVTINDGSNVKLVGCTIRNMGNWAVKVKGGTGHKVIGCDIYAMGQGGITLDAGDRKTLTPGRHIADNNHIHHTSRWDPVYQQGIALYGVGNSATHNLIDNVPHVAIGFSGNDQTVEFNEVHSSVFQSNDAGAIYTSPPDETWSMRGHRIRYNYLHNIHGFEGQGCQGVYLDDCFSSADISDNIFYDVASAILIGGGRDNMMSNNMFINCGQAFSIDARGLGWAKSVGDFATKELFDLNYRQPPWSTKYPELLNILEDEPLAPKGNVVARNVLWNTKFGWIEGRAQSLVKQENNLTDQDPLFLSKPPTDYRLSPNSPAWKLGFNSIPFNKIGVYKSPDRASWPVTSKLRVDTKPEAAKLKPVRKKTPAPVYNVSRLESLPTVDGKMSSGEWFNLSSEKAMLIQEGVEGEKCTFPSRAWLGWDDDALFVGVDNSVDKDTPMSIGDTWGGCDAVEISLSNPALGAKAPIIVLRGFANGTFISSDEAGAPADVAKRAGQNVSYKSSIVDSSHWVAEFRIPFVSLGIKPNPDIKYPFNLAVRKQETEAWVMWRGTGECTWYVPEAGLLKFVR